MDSQHGKHICMASGIFLDTLFGVDHQKSSLSSGSSCDHIFQKLNMSRCIQNNIISFFRLEKTACRINGNTLSLLIFQSIQQKRILKRFGCAGKSPLPALIYLPEENLYPPEVFPSKYFFRDPHVLQLLCSYLLFSSCQPDLLYI